MDTTFLRFHEIRSPEVCKKYDYRWSSRPNIIYDSRDKYNCYHDVLWHYFLKQPKKCLENNCDGNTHSTISLPSRESWVTINPIGVVIDTPNRPNILQNDGYDLTFRLYHPDDNNGFEDYTEATFSFYFATVADPVIQKLEFGEGDLQEGDTSTIKATISPKML